VYDSWLHIGNGQGVAFAVHEPGGSVSIRGCEHTFNRLENLDVVVDQGHAGGTEVRDGCIEVVGPKEVQAAVGGYPQCMATGPNRVTPPVDETPEQRRLREHDEAEERRHLAHEEADRQRRLGREEEEQRRRRERDADQQPD